MYSDSDHEFEDEDMKYYVKEEDSESDDTESELDLSGDVDHKAPSTSQLETKVEDEYKENKIAKIKFEIEKYYTKKLTHLTAEQWDIISYVYNLLSESVQFRRDNPTAVFIDGCVGSGKTEVVKIICEYVVKRFGEKTGKFISGNAIFAASYGVAALNYTKGRTAHSHFGFPLDLKDDVSYWNLTHEKNKWNLQQLKECSLIVYDEVTSVDKRYIHMLDRSLRRLMSSDKLFGGKIILFVGDFRQLAPVVEGARIDEKESIIEASLISSPLWGQFKTFFLTCNQRIGTDKLFSEFLMKLGTGQVSGVKVENIPDITVIPLMNKLKYTTQFEDIVNFVYPREILRNPDSAKKRAILVPRNQESKIINDQIVQTYLEGDLVHCYALDDQVTKGSFAEYESILDTLHEDKVFPDYDLQLKKGALCMIIRTMYKPNTFLNGEKVIVEEIKNDVIIVRKPGKARKTTTLYELKREKFEAYVKIQSRLVKLTRIQFPLKVCYAITIHKSQGQTLRMIAVDLRVPKGLPTAIFRHGQLHMALGRVRYAKDVRVLVNEDQVTEGVAHTHNMVHPELVAHYLAGKVEIKDEDMAI